MRGLSVRFTCPSSPLRMKALLGRASKGLWLTLAVAVGTHLSLTRLVVLEGERKAAKPLTTQFVKRQPRLTKPLELKKRPQPKQRQVRREMVAVKARLVGDRTTDGLRPSEGLRGLARPRMEAARGMGFVQPAMEPQTVAAFVEGAKEAASKVDMSLELLDVETLDTGQYHALVIQDPNDKRNIRGFFRLLYAYSRSMRERDWHNMENRMVRGVIGLVEAMNQYTNVRATFQGRITFDSPELLKTPWVFSFSNAAFSFEMPAGETANFGRYLTSGGFYFLDCPDRSPQLTATLPAICIVGGRRMIQKALETQGLRLGKNWRFERLVDSHPIFHCYFDMAGPPPCIYDRIMSNAGQIEAAYVAGRWSAILSQKGFVLFWNDPDNPGSTIERMLQFGVNTIIFALTQEGSITNRLMDTLGH